MLTLPVSIGEAFDKYSILVIKSEEIKDPERSCEIIKEKNFIENTIKSLLVEYSYQYNCLYRVNKEIWILTDEVNKQPSEALYTMIFKLNAMRFRIKSKLDRCMNSTIKEQKSYQKTSIFVTSSVCDKNINHKIRALSIMYDTVYLKGIYNTQIFKDDPQIVFVDYLENMNPIDLEHVKLPDFFDKYDFSYIPPYDYLMGGRLGDLIHLLYVIYVNYTISGIKGNLYITNDINLGGDTFSHFENTYNELYEILKEQPYIQKFSKYNGEALNINLNSFRYNQYIFHNHWLDLLTKHFKIPLIVKPWININTNDKFYSDTIIIHRSNQYTRYVNNYKIYLDPIISKNKCLFVTCDISEYHNFPFKDIVPLKLLTSLSEMFTAINSAKFFIGNQSSPLAMAYSLLKPVLAEFGDGDAVFYRGSEAFYNGFHYISNNENHIEGLNQYINI